jgi:hypothetical protein
LTEAGDGKGGYVSNERETLKQQLVEGSIDDLIDWCVAIGLKIRELQARTKRLEQEADLDFEVPDVDE